MRFGVSLEPSPPSQALAVARDAERLGFDYVSMASHVLASGGSAALDPLVLLSVVAGATSRIRIASSVLVLPYYDPVVLANQTASLDLLSGGRFTLAVGTGWNPDEFTALGVPLAQRGARTDEGLAVLRALWSGDAVDFDGKFTAFKQARIGAPPLTPGGPRVWVGGHSDAALRRALRSADGWHGTGLDHAAMPEIHRRFAELGEELGRDPAELELTTVCFVLPPGFTEAGPVPGSALGGPNPSADRLVEEFSLLEQAGVSMVSLWMPLIAERASDALAWLTEEVVSKVER
jgi:probable F420-dependent oxidoreductase